MDIKILSDELISQIAAGEVIERPASAVKELLENSLDAGADQISLEISEGGMRRIRVVDNGVGIPAEQVALAFERHATSKIRSKEDLFKISSMGFRGEALASIASISRVVMRTRRKEDRVGTELEMDGGKRVRLEETAGPSGTEVCVWSLFQHVPARKKYMKSERTEFGRIYDLVVEVALSRPDVAFKLLRDDKVVLDLPRAQSLKERIRELFGREVAEALVPIRFQQSNLLISGFVGKPELSRKSKKYQFLFVNGRSIQSRALSHAVTEAFHSLLMHEKFPWFALQVEIDPQWVDVNVHPRKLEVKFLNEREVYQAVRGAVHHALLNVQLGPVFGGEKREVEVSELPFTLKQGDGSPRIHRTPVLLQEEEEESRLRPVAQVAHCYIVAESEEGLVLIDQHAAHERVRYDRFMEALEGEKKWTQPLLTPLELDLGLQGARILEENLELFESVGFELEGFGGSTYLLRSVPAGLERREPEMVLKEMVADLSGSAVKDRREQILTTAACRGAIKFGDPLTMTEMQGLLRDMEKTKHSTHCPHGRPALLTFTFDQLETLFKRKNF